MSNPANRLSRGRSAIRTRGRFPGRGCWRSNAFAPPRTRAPAQHAPNQGGKDAPQSRTSNAIDILTQATQPLYIQEFWSSWNSAGLSATRDSLVSALTKVIAPAGPVVRVAPNTSRSKAG